MTRTRRVAEAAAEAALELAGARVKVPPKVPDQVLVSGPGKAAERAMGVGLGVAPARAGTLEQREAQEGRVHEPFTAVYPPAGGHLSFDGGHFACRICCLSAAAGVGAAAGGLPDDPGDDVLSGCETRGDGVL